MVFCPDVVAFAFWRKRRCRLVVFVSLHFRMTERRRQQALASRNITKPTSVVVKNDSFFLTLRQFPFRKADGVIEARDLKARVKYAAERKPVCRAISAIGRPVSRRRRHASKWRLSTRISSAGRPDTARQTRDRCVGVTPRVSAKWLTPTGRRKSCSTSAVKASVRCAARVSGREVP